MPIEIRTVCDSCGFVDEKTLATISDIGNQATGWLTRALLAREAGIPGDVPLLTKCSRCSASEPVPEGSLRVGLNDYAVMQKTKPS